jgi:outer membrane protein assembly factor BamD (BamD/ComL family)
MLDKKILAVSIALLTMMAAPALTETWQLQAGDQFQSLENNPEGKFLLEMAKIKDLIDQGKSNQVPAALEDLKAQFPDIAGADLDAFIAAELLTTRGKFQKAVRSYEAFLNEYPSSKLYDAAMQRLFAIGTAYLQGQKRSFLFIKWKGYADGEKIMDTIVERAGDAPIAVKAAVSVAQGYENRKKFIEAAEKWSEISSMWPTGQTGKQALLGLARSNHLAYNGPRYDASTLLSAKSYYENFVEKYPDDAKTLQIEDRIKQIDEQLAYKKFSIAKQYEKAQAPLSANLYNEMVIKQWPDSTAAKMAKKNLQEQNEK